MSTKFDPALVERAAKAVAEFQACGHCDGQCEDCRGEALAVLSAIAPYTPRVEIEQRLGEPTNCKVYIRGSLAFDGQDRSATLTEPSKDRTGTTWKATLPCPECGNYTVIGMLLVDEEGNHMHTFYRCTFWPSNRENLGRSNILRSDTRPCGWEGWTVPGWDKKDEGE